MNLVEDSRKGGFTFTWSIHNFCYCVQKESEFLESPKFVTESIGDATWYLRVCPRGHEAPGFLSYYLLREKDVGTINCVLSIRASNGIFKEIGEQTFDTVSQPSQGYKMFCNIDELKGLNAYLDNDKLTLRCRIWKSDSDLLSLIECYAYTKIMVAKLNYMWVLDTIVDSNRDNRITCYKFNQSKHIKSFSSEIPSFNIKLLFGETFGDDAIYFAISIEKNTKKMFLICAIHLLDDEGRVVHSVHNEHMFDCCAQTQQPWTFPFMSKSKLLSKEKLCLPNGIITLQCEFSVSTGDVIRGIERFEYWKTAERASVQKQVPESPKPWKKNMQRFYNEAKFSDMTVLTHDKSFPVHKAILCAQSEVFSKMFECDMKESRTDVVEIEDLEYDTVSKMLMFLYTNTLEDLNFSLACKLYFAADKYQISALHRKCSKYLILGLDTSNVCDVLGLADTHQDQELKSIAQDFVFAHDVEIIDSEDWKKLMEAKPCLTSETMQLLFCKKFLNLKP